MRLLYTTTQPANGRTLAGFLTHEGIENQLEMSKNTDWGSSDYGDAVTRIWVIDEDLYDKAREWADQFEKDPSNPLFQKNRSKSIVIPTVLPAEGQSGDKLKPKSSKDFLRELREGKGRLPNGSLGNNEQVNSITTGLLILCVIIYMISILTMPILTTLPTNVPVNPIVTPQINKELMYDYPKAYELVDRLVKIYGVEQIANPESLSPEGKVILAEIAKTPYWNGIYDIVVERIQTGEMPPMDAPLFEKIREGELWRLFTPCLLHNDILHLLFNMLWLFVLGKPIERRLGPRRYILLILLIGIFSNTCQYFMSGSNFIGFSGVVCGLLAFIWIRQKIAPWEGYPIQSGTIHFLFYFILAMLGLQLFSFAMEILNKESFTPGIANTAHFAGAFIGALLGYLSFFSWKTTTFTRPNQ